MAGIDRQQVSAAFGGAAGYSQNAGIQRTIASQLASRIAVIDLVSNPRILELGCGTGFLTRELIDRGLEGEWLITDKSPDMVERCANAVGASSGRTFAVLDGEYGMVDHNGTYDLICASMAMQWFDDLALAVGGIVQRLRPGGHLVFNTLAHGTFQEWRGAHHACGHSDGAVAYPSVAAIKGMVEPFGARHFSVSTQQETHHSAREFLGRLKAIGAATARRDHRPLWPAALKDVMAQFDHQGATVTYEVVTCHIIKSAS